MLVNRQKKTGKDKENIGLIHKLTNNWCNFQIIGVALVVNSSAVELLAQPRRCTPLRLTNCLLITLTDYAGTVK